ncbi:unnamed protein product [Paramecium octaurelia]|uniref:Uncharacterized protein n=1 Tax=Paramecium octaurelia TaxID=43137 RepID=A0A8S1WRY0_PAROT|nr:unnamed protein product [Paramecium octaurelia]
MSNFTPSQKLSDLLKHEGRSNSMHSFYNNRSSCYSTINLNSSLLNGWDTQNHQPISILTSNRSDVKQINVSASKQDITNEIVSSKHDRRSSTHLFVHSGLDAYEKYQSQPRRDMKIYPNYKQELLHEVVKIEKPFYITSVEEVERYWKAKELMLLRQKSQLEFEIKLQAQLANKKPVILKVEPLQEITQTEVEIQQLEILLKNQNKQINELKLESEELDVKFENLLDQDNDTQFLRYEKQLKHIQQSFKDLNRRFHETEEQISMKENEIESRKKQMQRKSSIIMPSNLRNSMTDSKFKQRSSFKRQSINSGTMSPTRVTFSQKSQPSEECIKFKH